MVIIIMHHEPVACMQEIIPMVSSSSCLCQPICGLLFVGCFGLIKKNHGLEPVCVLQMLAILSATHTSVRLYVARIVC